MTNIFKNAYFGKLYKTKDNRKAIYIRDFICNGINHLVTTGNVEFSVNEKGKVDNNLYQFGVDIISEWQEKINEKKLDELANECYYEMSNFANVNVADVKEAFKAGYRKAKQE